LDLATYSLSLVGDYTPPPVSDIRDGLRRGRARALSLLRGELESLREGLAQIPSQLPAAATNTPAKPVAYSADVFVVHGHDRPAKVEVARFIERAGLRVIILHEQPNEGRTIIEKFEDHGGSAGFAVVLLTPDDVGGPNPDHLQPRARQNVIGEMFWFAAKLGRNRVCALRKSNVELPSDFAGIVYIEMDDRGAWKTDLLRELEAAGYTVDWRAR
jgi:predicted nucleotide-binding protein